MSRNKSSDSSEKKRSSTVFTDSSGRYLGSSHKGLFGEEIYLDSSGHYAGSKRKGILGEEHYFDANGHLKATSRDGLLGTKIIVDEHEDYLGTEYPCLGDNKATILNRSEDRDERGAGATVALIVLLTVAVIIVLMFALR